MRPIFIPKGERGPLVEVVPLKIRWHGGFAVSQKQKNIAELHQEAKRIGIEPVLEVSTKSPDELGRRLSAFNLKIEVDGVGRNLESVYQSSKVFSISGRHRDLIEVNPYEAKKGARVLGKGEIIAFCFEGKEYPIEPKNAFYDWLYIRAIAPHEDWIRSNLKYAAYSDIEFTPAKSINCQGRAVAEFHALSMRGTAMEYAYDFESFRNLLLYAQRNE